MIFRSLVSTDGRSYFIQNITNLVNRKTVEYIR